MILKRIASFVVALSFGVAAGCGGGGGQSSSTVPPTTTKSALRSSAVHDFHTARSDGWKVETKNEVLYFPAQLAMRLKGSLPSGTVQFGTEGVIVSVKASSVQSNFAHNER